jgi:signal transduction histidine kinase
LGLAIVHNIMDLHRGTVDVEMGEKGGSVFTVLLPLLDRE